VNRNSKTSTETSGAPLGFGIEQGGGEDFKAKKQKQKKTQNTLSISRFDGQAWQRKKASRLPEKSGRLHPKTRSQEATPRWNEKTSPLSSRDRGQNGINRSRPSAGLKARKRVDQKEKTGMGGERLGSTGPGGLRTVVSIGKVYIQKSRISRIGKG